MTRLINLPVKRKIYLFVSLACLAGQRIFLFYNHPHIFVKFIILVGGKFFKKLQGLMGLIYIKFFRKKLQCAFTKVMFKGYITFGIRSVEQELGRTGQLDMQAAESGSNLIQVQIPGCKQIALHV